MTFLQYDNCEAVAIGGSAGSREVVLLVLAALPQDFRLPVLLCQHLHPSDDEYLPKFYCERIRMSVVEARGKMPIERGRLHIAPANYHLLVEQDRTLALTVDDKVRYARPSIDVLFESGAHVYTSRFLGVLLSGANDDGANGMAVIREHGGMTAVQKPATAEQPVMPQSAIDRGVADLILTPGELCRLFQRLHHDPGLSTVLPEYEEALP